MATPILILTADDSRIEAYRDIRERDLTGRQGLFVAEGEVVLRLMLKHSRFALESVLLSRRRASASPDLVAAIPDDVPLYVAEDDILASIAGFPLHRGILAIGRKGVSPSSEILIANLPERAIVVVCVGIANHDNMGGIFRNAAAFGASAVFVDESSCDPLYRKAIRVSVGASLTVPFTRNSNSDAIIQLLQKAGFATLALSPAGTVDVKDIKPMPRMALVLGAEGTGLPETLLKNMTSIRIPMAEGFDSLNVATTSGIALHQLFSTLQDR